MSYCYYVSASASSSWMNRVYFCATVENIARPHEIYISRREGGAGKHVKGLSKDLKSETSVFKYSDGDLRQTRIM